jgi:hypothetical protein
MMVVERHYIERQHQFFQRFDRLSFLSKNLYNHANYWMRQHSFQSGSNAGYALNLKQLYARSQTHGRLEILTSKS